MRNPGACAEQSFSIVVPTFRRPQQLQACLRSLCHLEYPRGLFEVLVVNDGTDEPASDVIGSFNSSINLTVLTRSHGGPAAARNTGVKRARGKYLAFTDDDCMPDPNWLRVMADRLTANPDSLVGGRTVNELVDNSYSATSQLLIEYLYTYFGRANSRGSFFATNNLAVSAQRFRQLGGFDPSFTTAEDREFCDRWQHHGYQLVYAPEAMVRHSHSLRCDTFWLQHFRYGQGAPLWRKTHFQRTSDPIRFGSCSWPKFYARMLAYPFTICGGARAFRLSALLATSQVAYLSGAFWGFCRGTEPGLSGDAYSSDRFRMEMSNMSLSGEGDSRAPSA
jgi:GT2 family glycosyltransferase